MTAGASDMDTDARLCPACNESYLRTLPSGEWYCPGCGYEPEHADDCNVWVPTEWAGVDHLDPSRDCTCGATSTR